MQKVVEKPERPEHPPRRTRLVLLPVALFAAIAVLFAYALGTADPSKLPSALLGKPAPLTELVPLAGLATGGKPVPGIAAGDLARGDVVVVNFFASWCGPCIQEHPLLSDLKKTADVRLVGINHKDPEPGGLRFLTRLGNPYDAVGVDANGRTSIEWGVYGMPETFVVNGRGQIIFKHVGPLTAEVLASRVVPAIETARRSKP
jgi:cytochrome c biogenesis protein CcmG, thiol:disulfide interchange protein DsbE